MGKNFLVVLILLYTVFRPTVVQARWASSEDANWELEYSTADVQVNRDGTYTEVVEEQKRVLKESGRSDVAVARLYYNTNISELKILGAKTILNGIETPVDPKLIEDKPLASSIQGFDQQHQIIVAFPEVKVGARVHLKYSMSVKKVPISGFYSEDIIYGQGILESASTIRVKSELPLFISKNDPEEHIMIRESKEDSIQKIELTLKRPIFKKVVEESAVYVNPKNFPRVTLSSSRDWSGFGAEMSVKYEEVLSKNLPPLFESILAEARSKKTLTEQINSVTSALAARVNYLGDWKSVSGRYVPRAMEEVATSKFGDCKDFSSATVAILRKLGYRAHVAFVKRGVGVFQRPTSLPSAHDFNHAMVYLKAEDRAYWIDPTNFVSFAQGIFPDISGRPAYVLDPAGPRMEMIPALQSGNSEIRMATEVLIREDGNADFRASLGLSGTAAISMTGADLRSSKPLIDYGIVSRFADLDRILKWEVEPYDLSSRTVSDQRFAVRFAEKKSMLKTSAGSAFGLGNGGLDPLLQKTSDRVSDLFLGEPIRIERETKLLGVQRVGRSNLNCRMESSWARVQRTVQDTPTGVRVVDRIELRQDRISNEDLGSPRYADFQQKLNECFHGVAIVYKKKPETRSPVRKLAGVNPGASAKPAP